jgi:hypothetical protein
MHLGVAELVEPIRREEGKGDAEGSVSGAEERNTGRGEKVPASLTEYILSRLNPNGRNCHSKR